MAFYIDANGVPICTREDLEHKADEVLESLAPGTLAEPRQTPITAIALAFYEKFGVAFDFNSSLGKAKDGGQILGKFVTPPHKIYVDQSLKSDDPRWAFTLAHEIGHLVLHRKVKIVTVHYASFSDTIRQIRASLMKEDWGPIEWIEWQANGFAAALLMPRKSVRTAFWRVMDEIGMRRGAGHLYVDNQPTNQLALQQIKSALVTIFWVSPSALEIRLKELALIQDARQSTTRHVISFLREARGSDDIQPFILE